MIFKKQGFEVYPAPTDFNSYSTFFTGVFDFFPTVNAMRTSTVAMHEIYGIVGYAVTGWL
jgi:hypothetical protein